MIVVQRHNFTDDDLAALRVWFQTRYSEKPPANRKLCEAFLDSAIDNQWIVVQDEVNRGG